MCRLLAWAGREPVTVVEALGEDELEAFTALSRQHADGWGMAWWPPEEPGELPAPQIERSTTCAAEDPRYREVTHAARGNAGFVHLRWATPGLAVATVNTHPFTHGRLAFAHNGAIHPQQRLDEILPAQWRSQMTGTTDSERYFLAIVAALDAGASVHHAVASVVHDVFARFEPTSLNAMLLAPDALYIIAAYDPAKVPAVGASARGGAPTAELDTVFYDLHHRSSADSFVVASSGFQQHGGAPWESLGNMTLLRVQRGTLATTVSSLETSTVPLGS